MKERKTRIEMIAVVNCITKETVIAKRGEDRQWIKEQRGDKRL